MYTIRAIAALCLTAGVTLVTPASSLAAPDIFLSPARAEATLTPKQARNAKVGPFGLTNRTTKNLKTKSRPVLLCQGLDGGIRPCDSQLSKVTAVKILQVTGGGAQILAAGAKISRGSLSKNCEVAAFTRACCLRLVCRARNQRLILNIICWPVF